MASLRAIQPVIFQVRTSIGEQGQLISAVRNWLNSWKAVWTLQKHMHAPESFATPLPPEEGPVDSLDRWRNSGFMKEAIQFWLIAQLLVDELKANKGLRGASPFTEKANHYDQADMAGSRHC